MFEINEEFFNIFELWKENKEKLPFKVRRNSWNKQTAHYVLVERIEVKKWPYGNAYGQYFYNGMPGKMGKIECAGTYAWRFKED